MVLTTRRTVVIALSSVFLITGANIGIHLYFRNNSDNSNTNSNSTADNSSENGVNISKRVQELPTVPSVEELNAFNEFMVEYDRVYEDEQEKARKFQIFRDNRDFVIDHNSEDRKYKLKLNKFADIHFDEFKSKHLGLNLGLQMPNGLGGTHLGTHTANHNVQVPDEVDWVTKGGVTPVKNQESCGSCWSFSATGALEGAVFSKTGKLVSIAEQEFVDCDQNDNGCNGGLMDNAFKYAQSNDLCTEDSYKYHAEQNECQLAKLKCDVAVKKGQVQGFKDVQPHSEQALMEALAQQPVSVAIEADQQVFQFYHEGVLTSADCGTQLDHGVLAVGYGSYTDPASGQKEKYWKVKNSWGPEWGQDGYILISRNSNEDEDHNNVGVCGIMTLPSYPVLSAGAEEAEATFSTVEQKVQKSEEIFV